MNVPAHDPIVRLVFDHLGLEPPLEQVSRPSPPAQGPMGIGRKKSLHAPRQVGPRRLEQQVEMVAHQHEAEQQPTPARDSALQVVEQPAAIIVIMDDVLPGIAPSHDVVDRALEFDPESSWHRVTLRTVSPCGKEKRKIKFDPVSL